MLNECDFLENILADLELPHVLSHNDIHHDNLILNVEDKEMKVIDYELMAMNYEYADLAYLLTALRIFVPSGYVGPNNPKLPDGMCEMSVKSYLRAKYETNHDNPVEVQEEEVEFASMAVHILETVIALRFIALCLCFINIVDIDAVFAVSKQVYADSKSKVQSLRHSYLKLKEKTETGWLV